MIEYTYVKGSENNQEAVTFMTSHEFKPVNATVNVDMLLCGVQKYLWNDAEGNVQTGPLTKEMQIDILRLVDMERKKICEKNGPKSMDDIQNCGLRCFDDYVFPGDQVTEDVVDYFMNLLPPAFMSYGILQVGEPVSHEYDEKNEGFRATFSTFVKGDTSWIYAGNCFLRETVNRTKHRSISSVIREIENGK